MCTLTSFTVNPPYHHCSTYILHLTEARWHFVSTTASVTVVANMGRLPLLYFLKMSYYFCYLFLINNHSGNNVGQDQELWMINATIWHFKEWCIEYNHTLFTLAIFWYQKNWTIMENNTYRNCGYRLHHILWTLESGRTKWCSTATKLWETLHYLIPTSYIMYSMTTVQFVTK